jgi:hypothetical protein
MKKEVNLIKEVPTLWPSVEEFKNFWKFVDKLFKDPIYLDYGAVKIIPPL